MCSHEDYGLLGLVDIGKTRKSQKGVRWYPVIGLANDTASFSLDRPWIDGLAVHNLEIEDKSGTYETPQEGRRFTVDSEVARRKYMAAARNSEPIDEPNWTIFETSLPHQQVIATARDVLDIYGLVFFDGPGIMGCNRNKVFPYHGSRNWQEISLVPENVFYHVGARSITEENAGSYLQYAVAWSVQPEEDSDGGWIEAIRGATTFATEVILVDAYRAWLANSVEG